MNRVDISTETVLLSKALYNVGNAQKFFISIASSDNVIPSARRMMNRNAQVLGRVLTDLKTSISYETARILEAEVENWESLSIESVFDYMAMMNHEERERVESFCKAITDERKRLKAKGVMNPVHFSNRKN